MMLFPVLFCFLHLASASLPWWKSSILYQIYPRSYADSNGDGNGDLRGIANRIKHLKDIGVGIVWLSPIFDSPMKDMGYDISDYRNVHPLFGNNTDLEYLIKAVHKQGLKLFLDFVPNHTSDLHPWFISSRNRADGKDDYYVWKNPKSWNGNTPVPPNGWQSLFGGSAWTFDDGRQQFYLHQFGSYQPDLNYTNPDVIRDMMKNMKFWFKKGIDGFRVDAVPFLIEDELLRDEPRLPGPCNKTIEADCLDHIYTQNLPGTYEVLKKFDNMLQEYESSRPRYFFLEAYANLEDTMKYYGKHSSAFNFEFIRKINKNTNAKTMKKIIDNYMSYIKNDIWPNWVMGNHDNPRVGTRMGPEMIDPMNMLILMLPGASVTYQGEEIGMVDTFIAEDQRVDDTGRDPERTPMQWDKTKNAGFSSATKTWLPLNPNYKVVNVKSETKDPTSHLNKYKRLAAARKEFIESTKIETTTFGDWVFGFKRTMKNKQYYVIINLNTVEENVILKKGFKHIPTNLYVHTASINSDYDTGDKVKTGSKITLQPRSAVGLSLASFPGVKVTSGNEK